MHKCNWCKHRRVRPVSRSILFFFPSSVSLALLLVFLFFLRAGFSFSNLNRVHSPPFSSQMQTQLIPPSLPPSLLDSSTTHTLSPLTLILSFTSHHPPPPPPVPGGFLFQHPTNRHGHLRLGHLLHVVFSCLPGQTVDGAEQEGFLSLHKLLPFSSFVRPSVRNFQHQKSSKQSQKPVERLSLSLQWYFQGQSRRKDDIKAWSCTNANSIISFRYGEESINIFSLIRKRNHLRFRLLRHPGSHHTIE